MDSPTSIDRDRLSVLTGALLLSLALSRFIDVPVRSMTVTVFGSAVGLELSATTIMLLISAGLAVSGVESLIRSHPLAREGRLDRSSMHWIVPMLLTVALASWLERLHDLGQWTALILVSSIPIPVALAAEYLTVDPNHRMNRLLQWGYQALIQLVAFLVFTRIYDLRYRSLISGTTVLVTSTLLATRIFWSSIRETPRAALYGVTVGLLLGQLVWALNYWRLSSLGGGFLLWLSFYVLTGLLEQSLARRLNRRIVVEYLGLAVTALLLAVVVTSI